MNALVVPTVERVAELTSRSVADVEDLEKRILHVLSIYPRLNNSMLQVGVGSNTPTALLRTVLARLEQEGLVTVSHIVENSPAGRLRTYTIIQLAPPPVTGTIEIDPESE
jgi:hypothetical protein